MIKKMYLRALLLFICIAPYINAMYSQDGVYQSSVLSNIPEKESKIRKQLKNNVIDVNGYCSNDKPILCNAIHAARVPLVALLLEYNASVSSAKWSPIHCALAQMDEFRDSSMLRPMAIQNIALLLMHGEVDNLYLQKLYQKLPMLGKEYLTKMRWLIYHVNQEPWIKELMNDVPSFSSSVARTIASYMVDYHQIEEYPLLSHVPASEQDRADMAEIVKMIPVSERINAALKKS